MRKTILPGKARWLAVWLLALAGPISGWAAEFVTSEVCGECHSDAYEQWQGSHHQLAMQVATPQSVLGNFANHSFESSAGEIHFKTNGGQYQIRTFDTAGEPKTFTITHTFGVYPLQQYLVDTAGGRKQALTVAWDSRTADQGGQRWFDLLLDETTPAGDELHWAGPMFNWNGMCAECHSTNLKVNYDPVENTFDTTFSEVSVGCEGCHGPGSDHVTQARTEKFRPDLGLALSLNDRGQAQWLMNADTAIAQRSLPAASPKQVEACGRCHARRSTLSVDYRFGEPLTNTHQPALLEANLYFDDGQIRDEVYVYGSFLQSRMYQAGVTCSDCHNPHSTLLKTPANPNGVCAQCHLPARFGQLDHGSSQAETAGNCVECHMKSRTYMGVDNRRDHSFAIPGAGTRPDHFGSAFAAARSGAPGANARLAAVASDTQTPDIVRATALTMLDARVMSTQVMELHLVDPNPLLRIGALRSVTSLAPASRVALASPLLTDPILAVRIQAANALAADENRLSMERSLALRGALNEARVSLRSNGFLPGNALALADLESRSGNVDAAEDAYQLALRVLPGMALAHHAYGLFLVRQKRIPDALGALKTASSLAPDNSRFIYVYAIALNSTGHAVAALPLMAKARERFPDDFDIGWALATLQRDAGQLESARTTAQQLASAFPTNRNIQALLRSLQ
ncbi:MAG: tetratricopeptide repeat protein [Lysobacterales bacterium]